MLALTQMPYQRSWADELQQIQLKREVAGTSRIEGAEFTEKELDAAMQRDAQATGHALAAAGRGGGRHLSVDREAACAIARWTTR